MLHHTIHSFNTGTTSAVKGATLGMVGSLESSTFSVGSATPMSGDAALNSDDPPVSDGPIAASDDDAIDDATASDDDAIGSGMCIRRESALLT